MKAIHKKTISLLRMLWNLKWWMLRRRIGTGAAWAWDYRAQIVIAFVGGALVIAFVSVMFSECAAGIVGKWFGTLGKKTETLQFLGWIISGFIGVFGLVVFNRRAAAQDENNRLIEKGLSQERFKTAVDHLSNKESDTARVASFYEFFYLARDNKGAKDDYSQTVLDILCAHFRRINGFLIPAEDPATKISALEVSTLIDILFGNQTAYVFNESRFDLQGVNLSKIDFRNKTVPQKVDFGFVTLNDAIFPEKVNLKDANFMGANLEGANLRGADLQGANLEKAHLKGANFTDANLSGANLREANLQGADLQKARLWLADLRNANLMKAELCDAFMENADFRGADFSGADLEGANLRGADFRGTDLSKVRNLQTTKLSGADYDNNTSFPEGFKPEEHGMDLFSPMVMNNK